MLLAILLLCFPTSSCPSNFFVPRLFFLVVYYTQTSGLDMVLVVI